MFKNADKNPDLLETKFPDDPEGRFTLEDIGLTFDDVLDGAYLDLTLDSRKDEVSPEIIISRKHGRHTEFLWKDFTDKSKAKVGKRSSLRSIIDEAGIDMKSVDKMREDSQYRPKKK